MYQVFSVNQLSKLSLKETVMYISGELPDAVLYEIQLRPLPLSTSSYHLSTDLEVVGSNGRTQTRGRDKGSEVETHARRHSRLLSGWDGKRGWLLVQKLDVLVRMGWSLGWRGRAHV